MYVIISDNNANGTFTGTNLNYIHHGLILTLNVQTILANIYQLMMQVIPPIEPELSGVLEKKIFKGLH